MTSRRLFLKTALASATLLLLPDALAAEDLQLMPNLFPQGLASGDPVASGFVLWTRLALTHPRRSLRVQVAEDPGFERLRLDTRVEAAVADDGCARLRVRGLQPGRRWYYRFLAEGEGTWLASPTGITLTTPAADQPAPLRMATLSCQDYSGRWYNTLLPLLDDPPQLLLHLGDFIYETLGDPGFQQREGERTLQFDDLAGAIELGRPGGRFHAARSLDNYRQLYRAYRSDPLLQGLLQQVPLVAIWDDHEFADDSWQATATHHAGRQDEHDPERKRNAERAWFEYMPFDPDPDAPAEASLLPVEPQTLWPATKLWRSLRWGRDIELLLTDFRSHRPDHLIPEEAYPDAMAFPPAELAALLPLVGIDRATAASLLRPCLRPADDAHAALREPLRSGLLAQAVGEGVAPPRAGELVDALLQQWLDVDALAALLAGHPAASALPDREARDSLPRSLSWRQFGKSQWFSSLGSRYFVVKDSFDLYARWLEAREGSARQQAFGTEQQRWLQDRLEGSRARWKLVASSVAFTSLQLDLSRPELDAPPELRRRIYLNLDQWDGFPSERERWINRFDAAGGVVLLSGDIHSSLACDHGQRTVELTTPAVSSTPLATIMRRYSDPADAAAQRLVDQLDAVLLHGNPGLRHCQTSRHGVLRVDIDGEQLDARFLELPEALAGRRLYAQPELARAQSSVHAFTVAGSGRLTPG